MSSRVVKLRLATNGGPPALPGRQLKFASTAAAVLHERAAPTDGKESAALSGSSIESPGFAGGWLPRSEYDVIRGNRTVDQSTEGEGAAIGTRAWLMS